MSFCVKNKNIIKQYVKIQTKTLFVAKLLHLLQFFGTGTPSLGSHVAVAATAFLKNKAQKGIFSLFVSRFFSFFSISLAPSGAKYCEKGWETLFGTFWVFGFFVKFQAVIKSAASAADLITA